MLKAESKGFLNKAAIGEAEFLNQVKGLSILLVQAWVQL